jgi:hypothetical protein
MKKGLLSKLLPHIVAVIVFLLVAVLYCKPALQGLVVNQHDITQWKGSIQQSMNYKETHGQYPLWTNSMFSGMPTFQIGFPANNVLPWMVHGVLTLGLPVPIQFFFLACICFYFLCLVLRINPWIGIFGALSFAYSTYDPVIISVGHDTKMWSIAYMPALLGSILLIFDRRYWLGAGLTALFTSVLVAMNHPQIDYYLFIAIGIMTVFFIINWIRAGQTIHLLKALGLTLAAGIIGVAVNAVTIMSTYEYQKETIRGGYSELAKPAKGDAEGGLSKDYAFDYSMAIPEPLVMFVPRMYGGSSDKAERATEESKAIEAMQQLPQQLQQQLPMSFYWGGIGGTSGPPYVGAVVVFLALLGFFVLDSKHKWWILTATLLACVMSWGKYFEGFNTFLYHALPMYNKFRAPSMILVIPQLLLPLMAVLTLNRLALADYKELWPSLKKGLIATGALVVILLLMYGSFSYLGPNDEGVLKQVHAANQPQLNEYVNTFFDGLKADRKALFLGDIFRSLGFVVVAFGLIYLLIRRKLSPVIVFAAFAALTLIDLLPVDNKYLNSENYVEKSDNDAPFQVTAKDQEILADKGYYRVFNVAGNAFAEAVTSYNYNSIGGYHAVKLRIYQDLIENQLSRQQLNLPVLNMLNVKYLLQRDQNGQATQVQRNDSALGAAWFVKNIAVVKDASAEMSALDQFNPRDTAFVRDAFKGSIGGATSFSGEGTISLVKNDNDIITYKSNSPAAQFAVFSEIYYAAGWKALIDGRETPITRVNYVLRGLPVPAGAHNIEFRFEPPAYEKGRSITSIFSILLGVLLLAGLFMEWRARHRESAMPA